MKLRLSHDTRYVYSAPVSLSPHLLYLRPRQTSRLHLLTYTCHVTPAVRLRAVLDPHDNELAWAHFEAPTAELHVQMAAELETLDADPFDFILKTYATRFPFDYEPVFDFALGPYLAPPYDATQATLRRWLDGNFRERPGETVPFLSALNQLLFHSLVYERREERGIQPSRLTLQRGTGACRDYAVLLMEICRTLGLAARFVSGYLYSPAGDAQRTEGAMHAWAEVYLPGAGWKGLDPTHGIWCDERFVPVAHAAQAESINPIQGSYSSATPVTTALTTAVVVERRES
jgi:transglutaminase-like putative cysteine protease